MLSGWADKGSDWKNTSHVIGNRFIKISNKDVQSSKESLEGYLCFTPTPMVVHPWFIFEILEHTTMLVWLAR